MAGLHSYSSPEDSSGKSNIAFFATVGAKRRGKTGAGQIIVFEQVVTNVGSAYNADHGFFTAPMPGLYQFSSTIMADNGKEVWARLCLNNKPVAYIYARATNDRHDQGSQTIILQLKKGEQLLQEYEGIMHEGGINIFTIGHTTKIAASPYMVEILQISSSRDVVNRVQGNFACSIVG